MGEFWDAHLSIDNTFSYALEIKYANFQQKNH